jgi:hypothetical protein
MMADQTKNFAVSAVASPPNPPPSGTTLTVQLGQGSRFPAAPFNATIWPRVALPDPANAEIVRVTAIAGDTLTIARSQENTPARNILAGDLIAQTITKAAVDNFAKLDTLNTFAQGIECGNYVRAAQGLYDFARSAPIGYPIDRPFASGYFGGISVTVPPTHDAYCITGYTLTWWLSFVGTFQGTYGSEFIVTLPVPWTTSYTQSGSCGMAIVAGAYAHMCWVMGIGDSFARFRLFNALPIAVGAQVDMQAVLTLRMQ